MLTPRYYQTEANAAIWNYFTKHPGKNPLVVLPTGAGKSLSIAMLIDQAIKFNARVVVTAHRKELIQQNVDEIRTLLPHVDVGIFSAGLKSKQTDNQVIVAGIQSVYKHAERLGPRRICIVDECHLISEDEESTYKRFLTDMQRNKGMRIPGFTATPYRTGEGSIIGSDKMFQKIVYEAKTGKLIEEGFLCPITNKPATLKINTDNIRLKGSEFIESEMQSVFNAPGIVELACAETVEKCRDRHSILVFCAGVQHADDVAAEIEKLTGERVGIVIGDTPSLDRSEILEDFKNQKLRWLINVGVLTTGFNARCIDAIVVLRATMSPGLFCQMLGRGLRTHESKVNCIVLDFGSNISRHGSIDDKNYGYGTEVPEYGGQKRELVASRNGRGKQCPSCEVDVPVASKVCPDCGFIFPVKHDAKADESNDIIGTPEPVEWIVTDILFKQHNKKPTAENQDPKPTVRVDYIVKRKTTDGIVAGNLETKTISEWVCPEHDSFARLKFIAWWDARSRMPTPDTVADTLYLLSIGACREPTEITTVKKDKFQTIKSCVWGWADKPTTLKDAQVQHSAYSGVDNDVPF